MPLFTTHAIPSRSKNNEGSIPSNPSRTGSDHGPVRPVEKAHDPTRDRDGERRVATIAVPRDGATDGRHAGRSPDDTDIAPA